MILYWMGRGGVRNRPGRITKDGIILVGKAENEHWNVTACPLLHISLIWSKMVVRGDGLAADERGCDGAVQEKEKAVVNQVISFSLIVEMADINDVNVDSVIERLLEGTE